MLKKMYFAIAVLLCVSIVSQAAVLITDEGTAKLRNAIIAQANGYDFTVGDSPLSVSALGVWDDDALDGASADPAETNGTPDGLVGDVIVSLFEQTSPSTGTLLASVTIAAGTNGFVDGEFRYLNLESAVTLSANTTYQISCQFGSTDDLFHHFNLGTAGVTDFIASSDVGSFVARYGPYQGSTKDGYLNGYAANNPATAAGGAFISGNMQYTVVPEPATLVLLGLGGIAMLRKKRVA